MCDFSLILTNPVEGSTLFFGGEKVPENGRELFGETARFGDGFKLSVDIFRITLLSNANAAYDYHVVLRINSVNDAMVSELVLPIPGERTAQRQAVSFGVNGELLLQNFSQFIAHTAVQGFDFRGGIRRVSKLERRF